MKTHAAHLLPLALLALPLATPGQSVASPPVASSSTSIPNTGADPAAQELAKATFETRENALRLMERNVALSVQVIDAIQLGSADLTGDDRTRVTDAIRRINEARAELETSITSGRTATELTWSDIHAELTRTYAAYATAVREGLQTTGPTAAAAANTP